MKIINVVAFKKRDIFLIAVIVFMVAVGFFAGSTDEESEETQSVEVSP